MRKPVLAAAFGLSCLGALAARAAFGGVGEVVPTGKGKGTGVYRADAPPVLGPKAVDNGISYHANGSVMHGTVHIYFVYYGNWSGNTAAMTILEDWARHIGGSPHFNINTTYYDGAGSVANSITFGGSSTDNYSLGSSLSDANVFAIVQSAIFSGHLPLDTQGIYFLLSSADVAETSGFCSVYCGWHNYETLGTQQIKYAFVGNHDRCPSGCEGLAGNDPNGNAGADGMISTMTHELEEAVTDPLLDAWYDARGNENGDKCAYNYGPRYTTANGSQANVHLGTRDYLIQRNWLNANGGSCQTVYDPGLSFYSVDPCRLIDTRNPDGLLGGPALGAGSTRAFALAGNCNIPPTAKALSINLTVTGPSAAGSLTLFPADQILPVASVVSFSLGNTRGSSAILPVSGEGTVSLNVRNSAAGALHVILDVNGYFQ